MTRRAGSPTRCRCRPSTPRRSAGGRRPPTTGWSSNGARRAGRPVILRVPSAPGAASTASEWSELPGSGTVFTYTVVRQAFIPSLADRIPYVVIAVDLDGADGARIVSNLIDIDPADVSIGMRVDVVWEDMGPELALPAVPPGGRCDRCEGSGQMSTERPAGRHRRVWPRPTIPSSPRCRSTPSTARPPTGPWPTPGLTMADVDGFASTGFFPMYATGVAEYLGLHPTYYDETNAGGVVVRGSGRARRLRHRGRGRGRRPRHLRKHPAVPDGSAAGNRRRGRRRFRTGTCDLRRAVGQHPRRELRPGGAPAHAPVRNHPRAIGGGGRHHAAARCGQPAGPGARSHHGGGRGLVAVGGRPAPQARLLRHLRRRRGLRASRRPSAPPICRTRRSTYSAPRMPRLIT